MNKLAVYFLLLFLSLIKVMSAQQHNWLLRYGGTSGDNCGGIVSDAAGNYYTCGSVNGTYTLGSVTGTTNGSSDIVVAKYNSAGALQWHTLIGGTQADAGDAIALDSSGNIYVAGKMQGNVVCGSSVLSSTTEDIIVVKLDNNGNVLWGRNAGSSVVGTESAFGISYSYYDNTIVLTGILEANTLFASFAVNNAGGFLAKMNSSGIWLWAVPINSNYIGFGLGVRVDQSSGSIYMSGTTSARTRIRKYTPTGTVVWSYDASASGNACFGMSLGPNGELVLVGYGNTSFTLGTLSFTNLSNNYQGFVIKMDTSGVMYWLRDVQGPSVYLYQAVINPAGDILISGSFTTSLYTDTTFYYDIYNGGAEGYILKLNSQGEHIWLKQLGTSGTDAIHDLEYRNGILYFSGWIGGTANTSMWPIGIAPHYGGQDGFVGTLTDCTPPYTAITTPGPIMVCEGDTVQINSLQTSSAYTYNWLHNGVPFANQTTPQLNTFGTPMMSGAVSVSISQNGCTYVSPYISLVVNAKPVAYMNTSYYSNNCVRDSVLFTATNLPLHTYQWYQGNTILPSDTTNLLVTDTSLIYNVVVTNMFGCMDTVYTMPVWFGAYPVINASGDTTICAATQTQIQVSGNAAYYNWSPGAGLNNAGSQTPIASPTVSTTYMVVGSLLGCTDTDYVTVNLHPLVTYPVIVFNGGWLNCTPTIYATYQWYMNNVPIVGANSSSYFPTTNNWYNCMITDTNGCIAYSNGINVNLTGTVSQVGNMDLHIFPNPAEDFILLELPAVTDETYISIKSINGQTIRSQTLTSGSKHTIQRDGLPAGVYLLEVQTKGGVAVTRVVFQ